MRLELALDLDLLDALRELKALLETSNDHYPIPEDLRGMAEPAHRLHTLLIEHFHLLEC